MITTLFRGQDEHPVTHTASTREGGGGRVGGKRGGA